MPRSFLVALLLLLAHARILVAFQVAAPCLDRPREDRPYSREHLLDVVKSQTPRRAEYLIRTCGVSATFNSELERDLRAAGAESNVIAVVREVAPQPVFVPRPEPARERPPPSPLMASPAAGDMRINRKDGLRYVYLPPGNFRMGCSPGDAACSSDEKPAHDVRISRGFWMGQTDVTIEAYRRYAAASGAGAEVLFDLNAKLSDNALPVTLVSWAQANAFCGWSGMRLPTEAEWEYAARAGTTGDRYGELDEIAWYNGNSANRPRAVALKQPNAFHLYDMLGNVWQWTADWYESGYHSGMVSDPTGPSSAENRVLRGGSWSDGPANARASNRYGNQPWFRDLLYGFRCAGTMRVP